jgi:ferritin-like metal-binding protein YciE
VVARSRLVAAEINDFSGGVAHMSTIKTMHDAFLHELSDMYSAEHQFAEAMDGMLELAKAPEVKAGLRQHIKETRQQISNIDAIFELCSAKAESVTCKGAAGIISEFKNGVKDIKEPALLDGFIAAGGLKSEHYEIATYRPLVEQAKLMGHEDAATLLEANLQMEESFAQQLEMVGHKLGQAVADDQPDLLIQPVHERVGARSRH